jgi:hypothetical protein
MKTNSRTAKSVAISEATRALAEEKTQLDAANVIEPCPDVAPEEFAAPENREREWQRRLAGISGGCVAPLTLQYGRT